MGPYSSYLFIPFKEFPVVDHEIDKKQKNLLERNYHFQERSQTNLKLRGVIEKFVSFSDTEKSMNFK